MRITFGFALGFGFALAIGFFLSEGGKRQCKIEHSVSKCEARFLYVPVSEKI